MKKLLTTYHLLLTPLKVACYLLLTTYTYAAENLISNPGFEGGSWTWHVAPDTSTSAGFSTDRVYNGFKAAYIKRNECGLGEVYYIAPSTAGKFYVASGYFYGNFYLDPVYAEGKAWLRIYWSTTTTGEPYIDPETGKIPREYYVDTNKCDQFEWRHLSTYGIRAPEETRSARIAVMIESYRTIYGQNITGYSRVYFDEMSFYELGISSYNIVSKPVNCPNPFRPSAGETTTIVVPEALKGNELEIRIYDLSGELVRMLRYNSVWDGKDDTGAFVPAGIYLYIVQTEKGTGRNKLTIAK